MVVSVVIPDKRWFPTSLQNRVAWYDNFNAQAQASGTTYGLTAANKTQIAADNDMMQFLGTSSVTLDNYDQAWTAFRNTITTGKVGDPTPVAPADITFALPDGTVPTGIFQRLIEYRAIIKSSLAYTPETGALYGIEGSSPVHPSPSDVKPTFKAMPAATNYHFTAVAGNRQLADSFQVWVLRKGASDWVLAATATGKSVDVFLTPTTPGDAEQIQVRIQLRKSNADYGQPSDPAYVVITP